MIAAIVGIAAAVIARYYLCDQHAYKEALSTAWRVFAGWLPMMMVILSLLVSNSDKRLMKEASRTGIFRWLIIDVAISTIAVLLTTIFLFIHTATAESSALWTGFCTAMATATIVLFAFMSWNIFVLARLIAEVESATNDTDS